MVTSIETKLEALLSIESYRKAEEFLKDKDYDFFTLIELKKMTLDTYGKKALKIPAYYALTYYIVVAHSFKLLDLKDQFSSQLLEKDPQTALSDLNNLLKTYIEKETSLRIKTNNYNFSDRQLDSYGDLNEPLALYSDLCDYFFRLKRHFDFIIQKDIATVKDSLSEPTIS